MSKAGQIELAVRRELLARRCADQRRDLATHMQGLTPAIGVADAALQAIAFVRQNPQWLVVAAFVVAALRPRRVFRWTRRGLLAWSLMQRIRESLMRAPGSPLSR